MIEVLKAHQPEPGHRDMREHCTCGLAGPVRDSGWLIRHQADALEAAGYIQQAEIEWGTATKWGPRPSLSKENALDYMDLCKSCGDDVRLIKRRAAVEPGPWEDTK